MTERGTFVDKRSRKVVVSQLQGHRSLLRPEYTCYGTKLYSARIIPFKGSWIEFATDINNVMYAYIDRKKKLLLQHCSGYWFCESDKEILEIFNWQRIIKSQKQILRNWSEETCPQEYLKRGLKILLMKTRERLFQ
jgi:DNA-directed RNA polymerase subunit beta